MLSRRGLLVEPWLAQQAAPYPQTQDEESFRWGGKVWRRPCPRVLPMGFAGSFAIACGVQDAFCEEAGLPAEARFSPLAPVPRKVPIWGACIDDVWGLAGKSSYYEVAWFASYDRVVREAGVKMSDSKAVNGATSGEVQGLKPFTDRQKNTWLGLAPSKLARVLMSWWALLGMAGPSLSAFDRLVGKSQHCLLPLRHGSAVLQSLSVRE